MGTEAKQRVEVAATYTSNQYTPAGISHWIITPKISWKTSPRHYELYYIKINVIVKNTFVLLSAII